MPLRNASRRSLVIQSLETRRLLAASLGANLIVNGGAEADIATISGLDAIVPSGWTASGSPTVVRYGNDRFLTGATPGSPNRGNNFFAGGIGSGRTATLTQTIDVANLAAQIDSGTLKYNFSGYLGGYKTQRDNAQVVAEFRSASGVLLEFATLASVAPADRGNVTGVVLRSVNGTVVSGVRSVKLTITFSRFTEPYNDGYADDLSLVFPNPATTGAISGKSFFDVQGDGVQQTGDTPRSGDTIYIDRNNNNTPDTGDLIAITRADGTWSFNNLAPGRYTVKAQAPAGLRVAPNPQRTVSVTAGAVTRNINWGMTETGRVTGTVFTDLDGNGRRDGLDSGRAGVVVYLDNNYNGQLDWFELRTTTDANGNYGFNLPKGTYQVRIIVPTGLRQTAPADAHGLFLNAAQILSGYAFGVR